MVKVTQVFLQCTARARYVSGGRGEDRQQYEELPKEGDGQKEKMHGTRD